MSILADIPRFRTTLDVNEVRKQFPALESGFIFADSAGGSQVRIMTASPLIYEISTCDSRLKRRGLCYKVSRDRRR